MSVSESPQALITDHIDIWTSAIERKSSAGRGTSNKFSLYGIKKLRELILELAVRGKLVLQDVNDEPASVLLERIAAEKAQLVKEGKLKKQKLLPEISDDEKPFELPDGWEWCRIGTIFNSIMSGGTPSKRESSYWGGDIPWASVKDLGSSRSISTTQDFISRKGLDNGSKLADVGDLLICTRMGLGKIAVVKQPLAFNQDLKAVTLSTHIDIEFFINYYSTIKIEGTGTTVAGITQDQLLNYVASIPPMEEQQRIVAKVDELMSLCDALEAQTEASISAHQTLVETLLNALLLPNTTQPADSQSTSPEPSFAESLEPALNDSFIGSWQRVAEHFDTLFTTAASIDTLKQTILQLAVMGKLVEQASCEVRNSPNYEPAAKLLERIAAEKAQLIKDGKIKKQKPLPAITDAEKPFSLPNGWEWCYLQDLFNVVTDGDHQAPPKAESGIPFLVIGNLNTGNINFENSKFVPNEYYDKLDWSRQPRAGDLLYTVTGSYGIPVIVKENKPFCVQRHVAILNSSSLTPIEYVRYVLCSKYSYEFATSVATGIAQKTVPLSGLRRMPIPVPPISEVNHIVAKVKRLMLLCDRLKTCLNDAKSTQLHLTDAIVEQAI
jgi:type I restriction enzyme S subunit